MEPCLFRHGKVVSPAEAVGREVAASMEPCLFRHGKWKNDIMTPGSDWLQWSHVFSDMVSDRACFRGRDHVKLQWSHVFSDMVSKAQERIALPEWWASMEPCLFRHGKVLYPARFRPSRAGFNGAMSFQTW